MTTAVRDPLDIAGMTPAPGVIASEKAVLGSVIQARAQAELAAELGLTAESFWVPWHQIVYEAAIGLAEEGNPVDPAAVLGRIPSVEPMRPVQAQDGPELASLIYHAGSVAYHAPIVAEDARRRGIRVVAERLLHQTVPASASHDAAPAEDIIDRGRAELEALIAGPDTDVISASDLVTLVIASLEEPLPGGFGIPTGLADLDALVPGLRGGQLIVIAARPGFGKSLLALGIARHAAVKLGLPVLLESLEMSRDEVMHRMLAAEAGVDLERIERHELTDWDWDRISRAQPRISAAPLFIDDAPEAGVARLRLRLRRMARTNPAQLVIVDYLQLMKVNGKHENRQQAVADLSRGLKLISREFGVPVVVCAQLNRAPEQRGDKRPLPSDLRESGAIEADADVIMFLHRADYYDPEDHPGEVELIVRKNRQGRLGEARAGFQGEHGRIVDLAWKPTAVLEAAR